MFIVTHTESIYKFCTSTGRILALHIYCASRPDHDPDQYRPNVRTLTLKDTTRGCFSDGIMSTALSGVWKNRLGLENHKSWLLSTHTITPDIGYGSQAVIQHLKVMDCFWDERISVKKRGCELGEFSCPKDHGVNKQKRMRLLLRLPLEPFATGRTTWGSEGMKVSERVWKERWEIDGEKKRCSHNLIMSSIEQPKKVK